MRLGEKKSWSNLWSQRPRNEPQAPEVPEAADALWTNARIAALASDEPAADLAHGAIAVRAGRITWIGDRHELPARLVGPRTHEHDACGRWITPGLIDCHTHLVHARSGARDFAQRLAGVPEEEIARAGGGLQATIRETRAAYDEELFEAARTRVRALLAEGVTSLEIKSGYGLDAESESKILRVARTIGRRLPVTVRTTFLVGPAVPPDLEARPGAYVDDVCRRILPEIARWALADAVDVAWERPGFDVAQAEQILAAAKGLGLPVKLHADQHANVGASRLGARHGALSVDHLEQLAEEDVPAIAAAGSVAVLLPGSFLFLRQRRTPPVAALRRHGVPIAIATDCNPGTSPVSSLLLVMTLACTLFDLTPREALVGTTRNAARAMGLAHETGSLEQGKRADFVLWDVDDLAELAYGVGLNRCASVVHHGVERTPDQLRES